MSTRSSGKGDDEAMVLEKIAGWSAPYDEVGARLHRIVMGSGAGLKPRLWYGMPGYAPAKSKPVVCFFRVDDYLTFGLTEKAHLERPTAASDQLIPSAWFFTKLDEATEQRISQIVRSAAGISDTENPVEQ